MPTPVRQPGSPVRDLTVPTPSFLGANSEFQPAMGGCKSPDCGWSDSAGTKHRMQPPPKNASGVSATRYFAPIVTRGSPPENRRIRASETRNPGLSDGSTGERGDQWSPLKSEALWPPREILWEL